MHVEATARAAFHKLANVGERCIGGQLEACDTMTPHVAAVGAVDPKLIAMASHTRVMGPIIAL